MFWLKCYTYNFNNINLYFPIFQFLILACIIMIIWLSKWFFLESLFIQSAWMQSTHWFYTELDIFRALFSITSLRTECYWDSHWWILVNSGSRDCSSYPWLAQGCCSWKEMSWPEARWCLYSQGFQHSLLYCLLAHSGKWFYLRISNFHLKKWMYKAIKEIILLLNVKTSHYFIFSNNRFFALILLIFMRD